MLLVLLQFQAVGLVEKVVLLLLVFVLPVRFLQRVVLCLEFLIWVDFLVLVELTQNLIFLHTWCMWVNQLSR